MYNSSFINLFGEGNNSMYEGNDLIAVKANQFVQQYKVKNLSAVEIRIINYLIANIDSPKYSKEFREFRFDIKDFYHAIYPEKDPGSEYNRLPKVIQKLSDKSAWKEVPSDTNPGKTKLVLIRWIENPEFDEGYIKIKLNPYLAPYLLQLEKNFIKSKFKYTALAQSKYTIPLYELLKSWEAVKSHKKKFELLELREYMDATEKSKDNVAEFKRTALNVAIKEINEITDLNVSFEEIKHGRKVTHIEFTILSKEENKRKDSNKSGEATISDELSVTDVVEHVPKTMSFEEVNDLIYVLDGYTSSTMSYEEAMEQYRLSLPGHTDQEIDVLVRAAKEYVQLEGDIPRELRIREYFEDHYAYAKSRAKSPEGSNGFKNYLKAAIEGNAFKKKTY